MPDPNKVSFGLKNVHYSMISYTNGVPSWGTPVHVPGAVNVTLSKETGASDFYADDTKYYHTETNNGYTGSLEMALFPTQMRKDLWGMTETATGKVLVEDANAQPAEFGLMFEIDGDKKAERYCIYRCIAGRPDIASATKADSTEVQTQSCDLTVMPVIDPTANSPINGKVSYKTNENTPTATYDAFFNAVDNPLA